MSEHESEMTTGGKVRGALVLIILLGGGLFVLVRELFF
jgi:hypothetical protein